MADGLELTPAGERGLFVALGPEGVDEAVNRAVHRLARGLPATLGRELLEVVPGYWNLYLEFARERPPGARLMRLLEFALADAAPATAPVSHSIPVVYGGRDLDEVARLTGLTPAEVVRRHSAPGYSVFALGFTPGFAYLGTVDEALRLTRLASPRPVAAGAVAIAGAQTGIYPAAGPGGWRVLGSTNLPLFDRASGMPTLRPGDEVSFVPADALPEWRARVDLPPLAGEPLFRVLRPGLLDTVQDGGRCRVAHLGLAQSGALDLLSFQRANALLGNPLDTPALELTLGGPVLETLRDVTVALSGEGPTPAGSEGNCSLRLRHGEILDLGQPGRGARSYLAVPGGLEAWRQHGSAATDLRAGIGGHEGRALRAGDLLLAAPDLPRPVPRSSGLTSAVEREVVLRLLPGPQAHLFPAQAWSALTASAFTVAAADRMGLRLSGPRIEAERHEITSEAVPLGSIQVPPDGAPILLLNDRGTLGGYAKIAIVIARDLPRAGQLLEGSRVRFRLASATR